MQTDPSTHSQLTLADYCEYLPDGSRQPCCGRASLVLVRLSIAARCALAGLLVGSPSQAQLVPAPAPAVEQPAEKIDSFLVRLPLSKERAGDAAVAAFTSAGLTVTNTTSSLVEADEGPTRNELTGGQSTRVVRAVLIPRDSVTDVLITGDERRSDEHGRTFKRLRIDNRAGGKGGKVWAKMVAAGAALDSIASAPRAEPVSPRPGP